MQFAMGKTPLEAEAEYARFVEDRDCFVLVCDRSGEEGRNLQFAQHLILYDLPSSPNRLEQRIGRVDRIGRRHSLDMHILWGCGQVPGVVTGWYLALRDGFQIFRESIAGLQFYCESKTKELQQVAFDEGDNGLTRLVAGMQEEIAQEKLRIEEQSMLDDVDARDEDSRALSRSMDRIDISEDDLESDCHEWLSQVLQLQSERSTTSPHALRYTRSERSLVPEDILRDVFVQYLGRWGTYRRSLAASNPSISLLRLGEGLSNGILRYMQWDDRGRAFAFWRHHPGWGSQADAEWIVFRFDIVVEASLDDATGLLAQIDSGGSARHALSRRADGFFPPFCETVFVGTDMKEIDSPEILDLVQPSFRKATLHQPGDHNLTKHRLPILDRLISPDRWGPLCRGARDAALELLEARPAYQKRRTEALASMRRRQSLIREQLAIRGKTRLAGTRALEETVRDLTLEASLSEALLNGVAHPRRTVDSAGLIVLSGRAPEYPLA
ncbi:MAG: hypothetical protein IPG75_20785 [Gemmatimonadetes bacterium]|nr:hypothetical protein [Gemmatimonadota bacterium]